MTIISKVDTTDPSPGTQGAWPLVFLAWVIVTIASLGSLFFSEIMEIPICELCWYQRIAMYPLVLILALSLFPYDPRVVRVVAGIIPESAQPCVKGIPCSETYFTLFGFLNIPTLSLLTFSLIGVLLFFTHRIETS